MAIQIEEGIEGIEPIETITNDNEFYKIIEKQPEGVELTIINVSKPKISKWQDKNNTTNKKKMYLYIDYCFKMDSKYKKRGISYPLGYPIKEDTYHLKNDSLLFRLLCLKTPNLKGLSGAKVEYNKLSEKLTDLKFIATTELTKDKDNSYKYILKPVRLI